MSSNRIMGKGPQDHAEISLGRPSGAVNTTSRERVKSLTCPRAPDYNSDLRRVLGSLRLPTPSGSSSMKLRSLVSALGVLAIALGAVSCGQVQARKAFKDGNKQYKEEHFREAIKSYERAVDKNPSMAEAWFYMGSAHQALYRPGKDIP